MSDPFDDPGLKEFLERARRDMFPKMKNSAMSLIILGEPDPKLCLELGAAILYDKPLIILVPTGRILPANLKRCATAIIEGDIRDPNTAEQMRQAMASVLESDRRTKPI